MNPDPQEITQPTAQSVALGGGASKPADFRPIGAPSASNRPGDGALGTNAAAQPQVKTRATHATFDDHSEGVKHRATISSARSHLGNLVSNIDRSADVLRQLLTSLDNKEGKAECKRQDFSPDVAKKVTDDLDAIIEEYKPRPK